MKDRGGFKAIFYLYWRDHEDALQRIAEALREEQPDPIFLRALADVIDPAMDRLRGVKLVIRRTKSAAGAPKAKPDLLRDLYIWARIDALDEKVEAVLADVKARFGIGRTAALEALKRVRADMEQPGWICGDGPPRQIPGRQREDWVETVQKLAAEGKLERLLLSG